MQSKAIAFQANLFELFNRRLILKSAEAGCVCIAAVFNRQANYHRDSMTLLKQTSKIPNLEEYPEDAQNQLPESRLSGKHRPYKERDQRLHR